MARIFINDDGTYSGVADYQYITDEKLYLQEKEKFYEEMRKLGYNLKREPDDLAKPEKDGVISTIVFFLIGFWLKVAHR